MSPEVEAEAPRWLGRVPAVLHYTGRLLEFVGLVMLVPVALVALYWGQFGEGPATLVAFIGPALGGMVVGRALRWSLPGARLDMVGSMLVCGVSWLAATALGALPFVIGIDASFLDGCFEAMSGFTTTGITVFNGLYELPRSILFWRALTQWLGGLGILSLFLALSFQGRTTHLILGAESHKIATARPAPGLLHTIRVFWAIYIFYTLLAVIVLTAQGMPVFDSLCHALTALSTGGYSPHDASIQHYRDAGYANYRWIEYTLVFFMLLGGINFLVHYRLLRFDWRALWDHLEVRWWWYLISGMAAIVAFERLHHVGWLGRLPAGPSDLAELEQTFRLSLFQVVSIITTTGYTTQDINSEFFGAAAKQIFLVAMVIGGCVGSTGGGIKVLRVAVLSKMVLAQLFKVRVTPRASTGIVVDRKLFPEPEIERVAALFFAWIALLLLGGAITALFTDLSPLESLSGMFTALGNVGPCYMSVAEMITIHPVVKVTYIIGMMAGRLEILPVLLLFSARAWR